MNHSESNKQESPGIQEYPACLSVVVPVYNEEATLSVVVGKLLSVPCLLEIIIVDDCSTDGTAEQARQLAEMHEQVRIVRHQRNGGKTAALKTGFALTSGQIVIVQDADLEYDPADVPALIEPIQRGAADVVFGSRLSGGRPQRAYLFWHLVGNRMLTLLTNVLFNTTLHDMETGYKAFRSEVLRSLHLTRDDFGIEPELTGEVCRRKLRVYELPIAYYGRTYAEGKKITWRDGVKAIWVLFAVRARS